MIKPYIEEGEDIRSFIFRMQSVLGINSYSNIITTTGKWKRWVYFSKSTGFSYDKLDQKISEQLLINSGFYRSNSYEGNGNYAENSFNHYENKLQLLKSTSKPKGIVTPACISKDIVFCQTCIEKHAEQHGIAFLKVYWRIDKECDIHETPLFRLKSSTRNSTIQCIKSLLSGNIPSQCERLILTKSDKKLLTVYPLNSRY